jgi:plasmid stabilization system protein ParE
MANKPVRFHPEAEQEYLAALSWYRDRSLIAATNLENAVSKALETIAKAPQRWPKYFEKFRKYSLHRFPFGIIYQESASETIILAIAHGRRRPGYWRKRTQ